MSKPKERKGKTKKAKSGKKGTGTRRPGFLFVLTIALLTFLLGSSFLYYKYHEKICLIPPAKVKVTVDLYFGDPVSKGLRREKREIEAAEGLNSQAKQVILELIRGSNTNLARTIPPATTLRGLSVNTNHIACVDFSSDLTRQHTGGSFAELLTIYSIVNSLTLNFEEIEKVQILVEGERVETIAGHISAMRPFEANRRIVGN